MSPISKIELLTIWKQTQTSQIVIKVRNPSIQILERLVYNRNMTFRMITTKSYCSKAITPQPTRLPAAPDGWDVKSSSPA